MKVKAETARRVGLARTLSKLGYCSRSRAVELIRSGRVSLNGRVQHDPETPVASKHDHLAVDGEDVRPQEKVYLMLNKPRGVVTTASDEKGRKTVYDLLGEALPKGRSTPRRQPWIAPVGRLDKASEGLLLLTNDSEWGAHIAAPETHLDKTYHVKIAIAADAPWLETLRKGVRTKEGEWLHADRVRLLRHGRKNCWLELVLDEGKNRQIRRMMEAMNAEVLRLVRTAIGPLQLGDLAKGFYRKLSLDEKRMLDRAMR